MDTAFCIDALKEALARHGRPGIFNTDQGSQFRDVYNTIWLIQRLDYQTPAQVRQQQLSANVVAA